MHTEPAISATDHEDASAGLRTAGLDQKRLAKRRAELEAEGFNAAAWATKNSFDRGLVYQVLGGARACKRGQSHNIAVMLGLKDGAVSPIEGAA